MLGMRCTKLPLALACKRATRKTCLEKHNFKVWTVAAHLPNPCTVRRPLCGHPAPRIMCAIFEVPGRIGNNSDMHPAGSARSATPRTSAKTGQSWNGTPPYTNKKTTSAATSLEKACIRLAEPAALRKQEELIPYRRQASYMYPLAVELKVFSMMVELRQHCLSDVKAAMMFLVGVVSTPFLRQSSC